MEQEFIAYLKSKKIDPECLQQNEPDTYAQFMEEFKHLHPGSFTMQKLFLINILRRKYHYTEAAKPVLGKRQSIQEVESPETKIKPVVKPQGGARPVIKPKIVIKPSMSGSKPTEVTKIMPDEKKEGAETAQKPKMNKPVIKPRIPKPKKEE